ncbi:MAG: DNA mismatch repair protein MutS, partial [Candidatus Omnitrophica bacterium]|nr:DNA mismatch repair protein MutS [Candidatus Omnitrophota bacterium]
FYEMFFDDAVKATKILHITLTARGNSGGKKIPMCGVPYHAADNYIARLIRSGNKVAICEQMEAPSAGKKIVKREITKIITPGTFIADDFLDNAVNNYILSLNVSDKKFGLAYADISTGEFHVTELDSRESLFAELYKISSAECLIPESFSKDKIFNQFKDVNLGAITVNDDWMFDYELSLKEIKNHFLVQNLDGFGCTDLNLAVGAAGALIRYIKHTQKSPLNNIHSISSYKISQFMTLDDSSYRHLELLQNQDDLSSRGTLLEILDMTRTSMGKRRLKKWILNPLLNVNKIEERLKAVQFFYDNRRLLEETREFLSNVYDIERLSNKISMATANARDIVSLAGSLKTIEELKAKFEKHIPDILEKLVLKLDNFADIVEWVEKCLIETPPNTIKEGGLIRQGYNCELDEVKAVALNGKDWLIDLQKKEIEKTGISSLKVGFNRVFGYYIEVTNAKLNAVPGNYIRKQTLTNAERFITPELKEWESKIIGAEERAKNLEYEIFCELRNKIGSEIKRLKETATAIAEIDVLSCLAENAIISGYSRPVLNDGNKISIIQGRHPVLEKVLKHKEFVPNDISIDTDDNRIFIITGSNMAGKSTFIRQTALIVIMAQIGSFVPAQKAEIGIIDRIFTRVGASDRLYKGMSTFMVEMLETANILNNATDKSLIILDEVGRGTSTFDGVSIAWAVVEYIYRKLLGAKALFATHYHELTELSQIMRGVKNFHLAVQEWNDEIVFLYKIKEGSSDESFGIHVAKLAGMPQFVVKRAREILNNLQKDSFMGNIRLRFSEKESHLEKVSQLDFFETSKNDHPVLKKILDIDVNSLTPLDALKKIAELKTELKEETG